MTEEKAIEGCKRQDRISQKHLFDLYSDRMLMVCLRYVQHLPDAEELMLNGFFSFYKSVDRFVYSGKGSLGGWMKKIMVNECLMFLRKKGVLETVNESQAANVSTDDGLLERMNANELFRLILELPAGYRTVFNLNAVEGYTHKEIAAMLGITEGTSKSQLNKARGMMQKLVKEKMLL